VPSEVQRCGHPVACIVSTGEGTNYCGWCAETSVLRKSLIAERAKHLVESGFYGSYGRRWTDLDLKRQAAMLKRAEDDLRAERILVDGPRSSRR